jgi:Dolichyl-phosphate-mannose-protein mannosyltransferase
VSPKVPRLLAVLLLGAGLRLLAVAPPSRPLVSDEIDYHSLATGLARSGVYSEEGRPTAYRAPGYPLFLASIYRIAGERPGAVRVVQALLDAASAGLIFAVALTEGSASGAFAAALLWAVYPASLLYARLLLPETLFVLALLAWSFFAVRLPATRSSAAALGAGVGILAWIKPPALLLLATLPLSGRVQRARVGTLVFLCAGAALALAPWVVRNARVMGAPSFVTSIGPILYLGNHEHATGGFTRDGAESLLAGAVVATGPEGEVAANREGTRRALGYIAHEPLGFLRTGLVKLALVFTFEAELPVLAAHPNPADRSTSFRAKLRSIPLWIPVVASLGYVGLLLAGIAGFLAFPGGRLGTVTLAVTAAWLVAHFVFLGGSRYHHALMPFAAIYAGRLLTSPQEAVRSLTPAKVVAFGALAGALFGIWAISLVVLRRS